MATTNILQWNPTAANQETDSEYLADSQRAGGATDPSVFEAELANKLFYQLSTYLTAQYAAFAAKGFTTSDSNLSTLTAQCANWLTTADLLPAVVNVAYAATQTLNARTANGFYLQTLTGNTTITAVTNLTAGQLIVMYYQQDGTGGRTVSFPASVVGAAQPDPAASAVSAQLFGYDNNTARLRAIGPLVSANGAVFPNRLTASSFTLALPGSTGQVLTNSGGVFVPENPVRSQGTASNVVGSRSFGSSYQNNTGGVICVSGAMGGTPNGRTSSVSCSIGPSSPSMVTYANQANATVTDGNTGFVFMVPAGWFYQVSVSGSGVVGVAYWVETQIS